MPAFRLARLQLAIVGGPGLLQLLSEVSHTAPPAPQARAAMHLREYVNDDDIDCAIR